MSKSKQAPYQNNPFFIALDGLKLIFSSAKSVAIAAIVLSSLAFVGQGIQTTVDIASGDIFKSDQQLATKDAQMFADFQAKMQSLTTSDVIVFALVVGTILFILILIGLMIGGVGDYTSARLARGEKTTLSEAIKVVFSSIGSYLWLNIIIGVKVFLWTLLFIIPGIIMAVRYSLAGVSFFEDGKRGNKAVKQSLALTKGAWLTTFASNTLWNIISFGMIKTLLRPGTNALLYRQYKELERTGQPKPSAHLISWLTLLLPMFIALMILLLILSVLGLIAISRAS